MKKDNFLPAEKSSREWRFRPLRTVIICVLIAALFVSMSVGLSYAKYVSTSSLSTTFWTAGVMFDPAHYILKERSSTEDTVFELLDGNVKITVPKTATGANLDGADYLVLRIYKKNYTVDYTKATHQYMYDCQFALYGLYSVNGEETDEYISNIDFAVDNNQSIKVEMKVGSEFNEQLMSDYYPKNITHSYQNGVMTFSGIGSLSDVTSSSSHASVFQLVYDKPGWGWNNQFIAPNADTMEWFNSSDSTYTISSGKELAELASLVNAGETFEGKTVVLGADIKLYSEDERLDLNDGTKEKRPWIPIGTNEHPFKGSFNGNGHTISGLNIRDFGAGTTNDYNTSGLFGYASPDSSVSFTNVVLDDVHISSDLGDLGSTDKMGPAIGTLIGTDYGSTGTLAISGISINNTVISGASKYMGGVMGYGLNGAINNCSVNNLTMMPRLAYQVGGIIGLQHGMAGYDQINISNCSVSNAQFERGYEIAGGIIAQATGYSVGVENCTFSGNFAASTYKPNDYYAVGILAQLAPTYYPSLEDPVYTISNCSASATGAQAEIFKYYHDNVPAEQQNDNFPKIV